MAHSSNNYMKKYLMNKRLKAKYDKAKVFVQWYETQDINNKVMLEMLERTIKVAQHIPKFRKDYEIKSPLEAKEKLDLCGWQKLVIHRDFVINDEMSRYEILEEATRKVVALEMETVEKYKINPLYILEDINIYLNFDQTSGKVYEEIVVSPELFKEIVEVNTE
jgi:hypothetical protein